MRDFIRQFLLYSRSERRAVVLLIILIVMASISPGIYRFYIAKTHKLVEDTSLQKEITQWQKRNAGSKDTAEEAITEVASTPAVSGALFDFDPNTIGIQDWLRLGLSQKQAEGIEKYKSKGGQFRRPEDLRRLYSLTDADKDRLIPHVRIASGTGRLSKTIEVNAADSAAFESLWGIGPVLSARIIKYRTQLGGFVNTDQIAEVNGIRDSVFMEIKPRLIVNPNLVSKININEADYETLRKHPYIHAKIAHAIIGYRDINGKFQDMGELKKLKPVTDDVYQKIMPYLAL